MDGTRLRFADVDSEERWLAGARQLVIFQLKWLLGIRANCCPDTAQESTYVVQAGQLALARQAQQPVLDQPTARLRHKRHVIRGCVTHAGFVV